MSKSYRHIKEYEKEMLELKSQGLTEREIGNQLGFSMLILKLLECSPTISLV